uniref:NADH dehydrogenase subunit 4 n=1 Tax=Synelmis amoureuxi TaxID=3053537 RepID=UPI0030E0BCC3
MLKFLIPCTVLLLLPLNCNSQKWFTISSTLLLMSFISITSIYSPATTQTVYSNLMFSDSLSAPLFILTMWISSLMLLASTQVLNKSQSPTTFSTYVIILNLVLLVTFSTSNLLIFYIAFETSLIPTLLLILGWGYQPERLQAGMYLMLYTISASLPLLVSITLLMNSNMHLSIIMPGWQPPEIFNNTEPIWWFMTIAAFLVKMPLYITHLWLPKAHVEAPVAGSMVLAGILLKLGSYGLLRMLFLFPAIGLTLSPFISSISLWGACATSLICIRQTDMKSLIAYSSVGHMGLMTAGICSVSNWGFSGSLALMIAHGLCSSALFALANMTYETTNSRSLFLSKGLMSIFPTMTIWWFMMSAANMAAPPSINLLSEIMLISSIITTFPPSLLPISLMSFLAAAYSLILFTSTQHGQLSSFLNPLNLTKSVNHTIIMFHFIPLILLILCPNTITMT